MPILRRPEKISTVTLPSRTAVVAAETQVLIVGGGPAGLGAAFGAARAGADVILAERYGFLGGNATAALVIPISSYYTHQNEHQTRGSTSLFPTDHGDGNPTIAGALGDLVSRLVLGGGALPPSDRTGYTVPFDPEIFKAAAFGMLDSAGANYLLHCFASSAFIEDAVSGAVFETKSGPVVIRAQVVVDCTGDGDMAASAGATFEVGREDGGVQPMTLLFRMGEFEKAAFDAYVKEHPDQWYGIHGLWDLIRKAEEAGELDLPREDILFFGSPHEKEVDVNSSRIINVLGTDVWDLTYAEWEGRRQVSMISAFFRRYVPGFEKAYTIQSGTTVCVRETRRILGEYQLTADDVLEARKHDDVIALGTYPIDEHNPKGKGTMLKPVPAGRAYDIPLRCLIPKGVENLVVAGRCISGTHEANTSYRVMPISMATGHAAGVCAAIAARTFRPPRQVPFKDVQKELIRQGAILEV
ncbi:MAG TPA: FAD-dependent oxidoreductase [Deltaproteobacteria bacterium]|jgi:hypothetical protein|nr:FAD-dependent oxidoreductase [Deltaproteobacteria bacterium]